MKQLFLALCTLLLAGCSSTPVECGEQPACSGECVDLRTDTEHCGACDHTCSGDDVCVEGSCRAGCPPGHELCDGVCVDVLASAQHCGGCDRACSKDRVCSSGACQASCSGLTPDTCGGRCVDRGSDPNHCGTCGRSCDAGDVCSNGACHEGCQEPTPDACSGRCVDTERSPIACGGCGIACAADQVCNGGACGDSCRGAFPDRCGRECVDTRVNRAHCGGCGRACPDGQLCSGGECRAKCEADTPTACGLVCADLRTDARFCGACDRRCEAGDVCVDGKCASECGGSRPLECDGECVDPLTDARFCGDCSTRCSKDQVCSNGRCASACDGLTSTNCSGRCADPNSDPSACGACGVHCRVGAVCTQGRCAGQCSSESETRCGDACVETESHPNHCGACGNACQPGEFCAGGACRKTCPAPDFIECGGSCLPVERAESCGLGCFGATPDRCGTSCVDRKRDPSHCGDCGHACAANAACRDGECQPLCSSAAPTLCDGGCTDTTTDEENCGGCGIECGATESCERSVCRERVQSVSAGSSFACVLLEDGRVGCFGYSGGGQLGSPSVPLYSVGKTIVDLDEPALDLALSSSSACAALTSGTVKCWGENGVGQLGRDPNTLLYSATPLTIAGLPTNVVEVTPMYVGFCALTADGEVWCWGRNGNQQIYGTADDPVLVPARATGIDGDVVALSTGANHTCVRTDFPEAEVWCWGLNDMGQCGPLGSSTPHVVAAASAPPSTVDLKRSLTTGSMFTCAIVEEGQVACWGSHIGDALGGAPSDFGQPVFPELALPAVGVFSGVTSLTVCAELSDGSFVCWGSNIGDGTNYSSPVPHQVASGGVKEFASSSSAYLLTDGGDVLSWGDNNYDQLGRSGLPRYTPTTCCRDW